MTKNSNVEIFGDKKIDAPYFNPFPNDDAKVAVYVIGGIVIIGAILLIPVTGGASALALAI